MRFLVKRYTSNHSTKIVYKAALACAQGNGDAGYRCYSILREGVGGGKGENTGLIKEALSKIREIIIITLAIIPGLGIVVFYAMAGYQSVGRTTSDAVRGISVTQFLDVGYIGKLSRVLFGVDTP